MGRKKRRSIPLDHLDDYMTDLLKSGLEENAFEPNRDIFNLDIKRRKKETKLGFRKRQNRRVKKFVEKYLYISKDGERKKIKLIKQQVMLIADVFYKRKRNNKVANKVIIWASRGGGKGVVVSVLVFLIMIWRRRSVVDMAGAAEQALVVYEYVKAFLTECIPVVEEKLLDGDPLMKRTQLKTGVSLKCIPNSPTQTRGKHPPVLIADEACQQDTGKDKNVQAAMNMVFSEDDPIVILLSTFHVPIGIFQEIWDKAEKLAFVKYKWDVYDTAQPCTLNDKCIFCDGKDKRCRYCKGKGKIACKDCMLTRKVEEYDIDGVHIGHSYLGCNGKCLTTDGYAPIENIFNAYETNSVDPNVWTTEFECYRPRTKGPVYDLEAAWACFDYEKKFEHPNLTDPNLKTVGVDWGWTGQTSVIGPAIEFKDRVVIYRERYFTKSPVAEISAYLATLKAEFGDFIVFADSSHPFENQTLTADGFGLWYDKHRRETEAGVVFNKWKEWGIGNIRKWFDKRKLDISLDGCPDLWEYLKIYKIGDDGKPVKKMDHGPDALLCAMLGHPFVEERIRPIVRIGDNYERTEEEDKKVLTFGGKKDKKRRQEDREV